MDHHINIHEAKANLSKYLALAMQGEDVYLCKRNIRMAKITPVPERQKKKSLAIAIKDHCITRADDLYLLLSSHHPSMGV